MRLAREALSGSAVAKRTFAERMLCIPRMLAARNARMNAPLDKDELADLTQDVQLLVWRKLPTFEGRSTLETWVYGFCQYTMQGALNKRDRLGNRQDELVHCLTHGSQVPPPTAELDDPDLGELLKHLSPREAEVAYLRHVDNLGFNEIASALGLSASSVKTSYYRGLEKLRDVLLTERRMLG